MDRIERYRNGMLVEVTEVNYDHGTLERSVAGAKGLEVVESRQLTAEEVQAVSATETERSTNARIGAALRSNADFLALEKPTATQVSKQVQALTRQVSALLRNATREYVER